MLQPWPMARSSIRSRLEATFAQRLFALPESIVSRLVGRPLTIEDQRLDPHLEMACRLSRLIGRPKTSELSPAEARHDYHASVSAIDRPGPELPQVRDFSVAGADGPLPARAYWPRLGTKLPLLVYLHGGGYVIGDLDTHDAFCRRLAHGADVIVVAVDYRLAPEHPFPAPVEDAIAAFRDLASRADELGADGSRLLVAGDSAGATMSAAVAQATRGEEFTPALAVLFYPSTKMGSRYPSMQLFREGFLLEGSSIDYFMEAYGAPAEDPRVSPLLADTLEGLPPHVVITAGFDPLRDEGRAYADALEAAGVRVQRLEHPGLTHGWVHMDAIPGARRATAEVVGVIRSELARVETTTRA